MEQDRNDIDLFAQSMIQEPINYKQTSNVVAYEKDVEYMKQQLPSTLQIIQSEIDDICDQLEYDGSVMFDEYPDKNHIRMIVDSIMNQLSPDESEEEQLKGVSLDIEEPVRETYCIDDAMLDIEQEEEELEAKELGSESTSEDEESVTTAELIESRRPGWGPRRPWGPHRPPRRPCHGRYCPPPRPPKYPCYGGYCPPRHPCHGILCPIIGRPCGPGRWCTPYPYADYDKDGNPNWQRHLVENMLINEMNYRRSRHRERNI